MLSFRLNAIAFEYKALDFKSKVNSVEKYFYNTVEPLFTDTSVP